MRFVILFGLVLAFTVCFVGCGGSSPAPQQVDKKDAEAEIKENLAGLSADERAAAEKQRTCVVSGKRLGSMGVPPKVEVQGRTVWLCCDGCEDELKGNPEKYLAKLEAKGE